MAVVFCAECNHVVSKSAAGCTWCGAPISKANPKRAETPVAGVGPLAKAVAGVSVAGIVVTLLFSPGKGKGIDDIMRRGPSLVPQAEGLVTERMYFEGCRYDWRACLDNRDWARNADRTAPRAACLTLATSAEGDGQIVVDRAHGGRRFDDYLPGASIRRGYIVLVDPAGLVRHASGGWVRASLHCTYDFGSSRAHSVAPA